MFKYLELERPQNSSSCNNDVGYKKRGQIIAKLGYSDDIVLMKKVWKELQRFIDAFVKASNEVDLELNISNTKWMMINKRDTKPLEIKIGQKTAEEVTFLHILAMR